MKRPLTTHTSSESRCQHAAFCRGTSYATIELRNQLEEMAALAAARELPPSKQTHPKNDGEREGEEQQRSRTTGPLAWRRRGLRLRWIPGWLGCILLSRSLRDWRIIYDGGGRRR